MFENINTWREFIPLVLSITIVSTVIVGAGLAYLEKRRDSAENSKPRGVGIWL